MFRSMAFALTATLLLGACQSQATSGPGATPRAATPKATERPQTEAACTAAGGRWAKGGLAGMEQCFLDYPDAGKACAAAGDCMGMCLAPANGPARCQTTHPLFGCVHSLDAQGNRVGICID